MAYGEAAQLAGRRSAEELHKRNGAIPVAVISDFKPDWGDTWIQQDDRDPGGRWAKLNANALSPFDYTLYLDADTMPRHSVEAGFSIIEAGWDVVIAPSEKQGELSMWHLSPEEREYTHEVLGYEPVQLQGGVMFFRKCEAVHTLFAKWREEWKRWRDKDQGALLRALDQVPVRLWLLGRPWNGGAVIEHWFGQARRDSKS